MEFAVSDDGGMWRILLAMAVWGATFMSVRADESAFAALRTARRAVPSGSLVEMTGDRADPRPQQWKVVFNDPTARGGIREIVVSDGTVVSERTPLRGYTGGSEASIDPSRLKIDSDGAFGLANKLAIAQRVAFNWVDFTLRAHNVTGTPMWVVRYFDHMGAPVGVAQISAENGDTIMPLNAASSGRRDEERSATERRIGGVIGTVGGILENTARKVTNTTLRAVGTVEETLTGERTIGPKDDDE